MSEGEKDLIYPRRNVRPLKLLFSQATDPSFIPYKHHGHRVIVLVFNSRRSIHARLDYIVTKRITSSIY